MGRRRESWYLLVGLHIVDANQTLRDAFRCVRHVGAGLALFSSSWFSSSPPADI